MVGHPLLQTGSKVLAGFVQGEFLYIYSLGEFMEVVFDLPFISMNT